MITRIEWQTGGPVHLQSRTEGGTILTDVPNAMTLCEASRVLKKTRRHLYRYVQRGWITPLAKFSGEYFIDPKDIARIKEQDKDRQSSLSPRLAPLFPDHDLKSLHINRDGSLILTRILERGTSADLRWLKKRIPFKKIKDFLKSEGQARLSPQAQRFWALIANVKPGGKPKPWQELGRQLGGVA